MPKHGRKSVRVELDREDYAALVRLAKKQKVPLTYMIRALIRQADVH